MAIALVMGMAMTASAATRTWVGAAPDSYWTNAANWSPAGAPVNGDTLVFPGGVPQTINTNRGGGLTSVASLQFSGTNYSLLSPNPLTLTGGITHTPPGNVTNFCRIGLTLGADQTWSLGNGTFMVQSNVAIGPRTLLVEDGSANLEFRVGPSGSGQISKIGSGTMAFLAPTPFSGTLATRGGLVLVNDDFAGNIVADTAATVGTTNSSSSARGLTMNFGGTLSPGLSGRNIFTSSNSVFFQAGATFRVDLSASGTPGFGHDQLVVYGGVTLNGATLDLQTSGIGSGGTSYRIIDNDGPDAVSSIFRGLPEGKFLTNNAQLFQVTYRGGDGNDVVLRKVPIVPASVRHWTGAGVGGGWSNPANWSNAVAPAFGDILIFPAGVTKVITTNDFADERAFGGLRFFGTNYQVHGNRFALGGTGLLFTNTSGTNTILADVTLVGPQTWDIPGTSRTLQMFGEILGTVDADLFKGGAGTLVLTNNPQWLGSITTSNGPIVVNGDNGRAAVNLGSAIRGPGPVGTLTATNDRATLEPGATRLRVNGDFTLANGANYTLVLSGAIEGVNYGTVSVTGAVEISDADLFVTTTFVPALGTEFILIRNDGTDPVNGAGFLAKPEGAVFLAGSRSFAISYHGGDGNDVSLTAVSTPTGVVRVWDGGGGANGLWNNRFNWDSDVAVQAGDSLVFTHPNPESATNDFAAGTAFNSISFTAQNGFSSLSLMGNAFGLLDGVTSSVSGTAQIFNPVDLLAAQTFGGEGTGQLNLFGSISGDIGAVLTVDRRGTTSFGGSTANTFLGETHVRRGQLSLLKLDGVPALGGAVEIGGQGSNASVRVRSSGQLAAGKAVTLLDAGANLSFQERVTNSVGVLTTFGGDVDLGLSRLNATGFLAANDARLIVSASNGISGVLSVTGPVSLSGCRLELNLKFSPPLGAAFTLIANDGVDAITGTFSQLNEGDTFAVGAAQFRITYRGGTGNDVVVSNLSVLPSGLSAVWDGGGAGNLWVLAPNWVGDATPGTGDDLVFPSSVPASERTNVNNVADLTVNHVYLGGTNWNLSGSRLPLLDGITATNRGIGLTPVLNLPLELKASQTWHVERSSLNVRSSIDLATNSLTLQATAGEFDIPANVHGAGEIIKRGSGELNLSGTNDFTGGMRIEAGVVRVRKNHLAGPRWEMTGGKLMLSAGIPGLNAVGGTLAVSLEVEDVVLGGNLTLGNGAMFDLDNQVHHVRVRGAVDVTGSTLTNAPAGSFLDFGAREIILIDNDGIDPVTGTFANLPEGALLPTGVPGITNRLSYAGGDGNDVTLTRLPPAATHITRIWDGGGTNTSWQTASNWVADFLPETGDDLLFPAAALRKTNHINTAGAINLVLANSLQFDGAGYVIGNQISVSPLFEFGALQLTEGIRALQASGANTLQTLLALAADQDWHVASGNATLRIGGLVSGEATVRKTGAGLLEITNVIATNGTRYLNVAGPALLRDTSFEAVAVSGGRLDLSGSSTLRLDATGGVTRLDRAFAADVRIASAELQAVAAPLNLGQGTIATNIMFNAGTRLVVEFPTSNSTAFLVQGPVTIADTELDVRVDYPIRPGERLAVVGPFVPGTFFPFPPFFGSPSNVFPSSVTGTFNELPDGAVRKFSGRPYRINYSVELGTLGTFPAVMLTALAMELRLTNAARLPNGGVVLQGLAEPGASVIVEATQDFSQYTVIGNALVNAAGQFQFTDTSAAALSKRFYRVRYP